jgi:hypothetical protein
MDREAQRSKRKQPNKPSQQARPQVGRPVGAETAERVDTVSLPAACPKCHSTRRKPYTEGVVADRKMSGVIDGRPYNRIVWRRTQCADCGQALTVREFHFAPESFGESAPEKTPSGAEF